MLICNEAYVEGKKPQKIFCKLTENICVHVRYCGLSMKYEEGRDRRMIWDGRRASQKNEASISSLWNIGSETKSGMLI